MRGMLLQLGAGMIATASPSGTPSGLKMTSYSNTAFFDSGKDPKPISHTISSLEGLKLPGGTAPHSVLLSGALKPAQPGKYGFQLTFEPARERHQPIAARGRRCSHTLLACAVPFPSPLAYARLWVDDHLLYPRNTTLNPAPEAASSAPLWLPLPPRALQGERVMDTPGAAPLANYTLRVEYACLAAAGCAPRALTLRWSVAAQARPWEVLSARHPRTLSRHGGLSRLACTYRR